MFIVDGDGGRDKNSLKIHGRMNGLILSETLLKILEKPSAIEQDNDQPTERP